MYSLILEECEALDEWTKDVKNIAKVVKEHANMIWTKVLQLVASFFSDKSAKTKVKTSLNREPQQQEPSHLILRRRMQK